MELLFQDMLSGLHAGLYSKYQRGDLQPINLSVEAEGAGERSARQQVTTRLWAPFLKLNKDKRCGNSLMHVAPACMPGVSCIFLDALQAPSCET